MQGIFQKENTDKALKYGIYRHLPTYEKIIRNLVSFYMKKSMIIIAACIMKIHFIYFPCKNPAEVEADNFSNIDEISSSDSLKPPVIHC